jgi:hypothetical protein
MCGGVLVAAAVLARLLRAVVVMIVGIAVIAAIFAYLNGIVSVQ